MGQRNCGKARTGLWKLPLLCDTTTPREKEPPNPPPAREWLSKTLLVSAWGVTSHAT